MRNMKIGVRLAAGFFVILLMLVAGAAGSYFNVGRLNGAVLELTQEKWASSEMVNDLKDGMDEISLSAASMRRCRQKQGSGPDRRVAGKN